MHITFLRAPDPDRERRQLKAQLGSRSLGLRLTGGVILVLAFVSLVYGLDQSAWSWLVIGYLLLVVGVYFVDLPRKLVRVTLKRHAYANSLPTEVTVTEGHLTAVNSAWSLTVSWAAIGAVAEVSGFWVLRDPSNFPRFVIPQECLTPDDQATLRAFLASRNLASTAYRVG